MNERGSVVLTRSLLHTFTPSLVLRLVNQLVALDPRHHVAQLGADDFDWVLAADAAQ